MPKNGGIRPKMLISDKGPRISRRILSWNNFAQKSPEKERIRKKNVFSKPPNIPFVCVI